MKNGSASQGNNKFGGNSSSNSNKFGGNSSSNNKFGSNSNNKFGNNSGKSSSNQVTSFSSKSSSAPPAKSAASSKPPSAYKPKPTATRTAAAGGAAVGGTAAAGGDVVSLLIGRILGLQVPVIQPPLLQFAMGLLNCFFFGVGVIVCGALNNDLIDVVIGILQLVIPFAGWVWAVIWGILMILTLLQ